MDFREIVFFIVENSHHYGYVTAFLAALLETIFIIGLFLPGSTIILFLGLLAAQGHLKIEILFLLAVGGAVLGDNVNYFLGRKYGNRFANKDRWFLKKEHFLIAREFFQRHGAKSVFFGRFVPSIKEIIPIIAGTVKMPRKKFFLWNVVGAIGWGLEWLMIGYFFGHSVSLAKNLVFKISLLASIPLLISVVSFGLSKKFFAEKNKS